MKKLLTTILVAVPALLCAGACTDFLYEGEIDLTPVNEEEKDDFVYPASYEFQHPGALVTKADFDRVRAKVQQYTADPAGADTDPVYQSWLQLCNSKYAQLDYQSRAVPVLVRGDVTGTGVSSENYLNACRDAAAAFQLGLRYQISGDERYANKAVNILNEWADVCHTITANDANFNLLAGFQGYQFANAAELLRDYEGWQVADQNAFKTWLLTLWYPINYEFIDTHGGDNVCDLHYWSNWELGNLASILAIGIYTENVEMVNFVYRNFREGEGSGALHNMIPYEPVADPAGNTALIAQCMESGRDQGHATLVSSVCAELCQMAGNVKVAGTGEALDFFGMEDNLVLSMFEYTAMYNSTPYTSVPMPFTRYEYCPEGCGCPGGNNCHTQGPHLAVSSDGQGTLRPCWDLIYNHYKAKGVSDGQLYYSKRFAEQLRSNNDGVLTGDCGAGDSRYNNDEGSETSATFDQLGWGTLLFYRDWQ